MSFTVTDGDIIGAVALVCMLAFIVGIFIRGEIKFERSWRMELQRDLEAANRTIAAVRAAVSKEVKP